MFLHFLHALTNDRDRVQVFLFGTRLTNVTRELKRRDIDEAIEFGFNVYGTGAVPSTARGRVMGVACQEPIVVGGVRVRPGDWVLADSSGIAFVPAGRAEEVISTAEALAAREQQMLQRIREGGPVSQVMSHNYENMLKEAARG